MNFALSPDLNDSIHVMSVVVKSCNQMMLKLGTMLPSDQSSPNKPSNALYHGCRSIHDALKFAIAQKLLDIAIDPQGMTPNIFICGAMQFQHDVMAFDRLFRVGGGGGAVEKRSAASNKLKQATRPCPDLRGGLRQCPCRTRPNHNRHHID